MDTDKIAAGARTVAHLAVYFDELKQSANAMADSMGASRRGYFTPSEDDAVRRLLASYWNARAALFDVVLSFREDAELDDDLRPAAFLVAYAAALLLVDAARYLRDTFHARRVVRAKLNEPEPHFGIPAGVYDAIQKSLTSPRHAWHLYHAREYFGEHRDGLIRLATDPLLAPALAVIERLESRVDVPALRYVRARVRVRARRLASRVRHGLWGQSLYGLQKLASLWVSDISTRPGHRPHLPAEVAQRLADVLQPGDVLVTRKEFAATNYFLPGYWKHAALYLGEPGDLVALGLEGHENVRPRWAQLLAPDETRPRRVLEALKDGVHIRPVRSPLESDAVTILRPHLGRDDRAEALARALFHEGKPYDFDFDFTRSDRLVCTEVVYRAYEGIGSIAFVLSPRAGRLTLSAEDLIGMAIAGAHFEPVAAFSPAHAAELASGPAAETLLEIARQQGVC
ncbi:MAG: hypothetical protein JW809_13555 [Pirellulales bacterium]|nr:hypothetical protein [Pirellulales bacterium]